MPVRSLSSPVLKWPDAAAVDRAARAWAVELVRRRGDVLGVAYIGSYARGDWGVGSDLDLVLVIKQSQQRFWNRASELDLVELPVPAEAITYTADEWRVLAGEGGRFFRTVRDEGVWLYRAPGWKG
jgi:predicted nucleotidyltransferase